MTMTDFMGHETMQGAAETPARTCHKCHKEKPAHELTFCSYGDCDNEACCDCQSETEYLLEVCSDRCALGKVAAMQRELTNYRANAATAAAIVRRGAASYVLGKKVA